MKSASSSGRSKSSGRSSSSSYRKGSNSSSSGSQSSSSRRPQQQSRLKPAQRQAPVETVASSLPGDDGGEWLAKALASSGVASRRACIDLVKAGKVKVNGVVVTDPATKVDASADRLFVDGKRVSAAAAATSCYFAVHKPAGYICSNVSKEPGTRAVDLLQPWLDKWQDKHRGQLPPRLFTVGRLDVATSGLLFITNDGDWANQVIHPSADITKEYWVTLPQDPSQKELQQLRAGTAIDGVRVVPKVVQILRRSISTSDDENDAADAAAGPAGQRSSRRGSSSNSSSGSKGGKRESSSDEELGMVEGVGGSREKLSIGGKGCVLRLDVSEGKKHEVRLLVAAAGLRLLRLKRVRVGGFVMPDKLRAGQYMELTVSMRAKILQQPR